MVDGGWISLGRRYNRAAMSALRRASVPLTCSMPLQSLKLLAVAFLTISRALFDRRSLVELALARCKVFAFCSTIR